MTKIELFEDIINERNFGILKELNISSALFRSYEETRYLGLDFITFMDIIWEDDFKVIAQNLKDFEIDAIQIADTSTALLRTLIYFEEAGFELLRSTCFYDNWGDPKSAILMKRKR